jgi:peroxiredoxin
MAHKEGHGVPYIQWHLRVDGSWETVDSDYWFKNKTVVVFSLPGAFTPTCSTQHLPGYEDRYQEFKDEGIDDIYCISVNDAFVMNAWGKDLGIENVKLLPDGNGMFTKRMEQMVEKQGAGMGSRSWRYAMIVKDQKIIKQWVEEGKGDNIEADPYSNTDPGTVINWIKGDFGKDKLSNKKKSKK